MEQATESRFITAKEIAKDANISATMAYRVIRQLNEKLEEQGFFTFRGKTLRRAYYEYTGGR